MPIPPTIEHASLDRRAAGRCGMTLAWHARETPDRPAILAPALVALAYVGLDDLDRAIPWLERALDERGFWTMYVNVEPGFTSLRTG